MSIYKIISKNTDKVFIGYCVETDIKKQYNKHVDYYCEYLKTGRKYDTSHIVFKYGDNSIELICNVNPTDDVQDLLTHHINENNSVNYTVDDRKYNKKIIRTEEDRLEYMRNYYTVNKNKMRTQINNASAKRKINDIVIRLNNNMYNRIPKRSLKKYNILYNENEKKYYV
jgi:hypothetical protein